MGERGLRWRDLFRLLSTLVAEVVLLGVLWAAGPVLGSVSFSHWVVGAFHGAVGRVDGVGPFGRDGVGRVVVSFHGSVFGGVVGRGTGRGPPYRVGDVARGAPYGRRVRCGVDSGVDGDGQRDERGGGQPWRSYRDCRCVDLIACASSQPQRGGRVD